MAKKPPPAPLLANKHAFIDSLDNVLHESIMLLQALEMSFKHDTFKSSPVTAVLKERVAAFRKSIFTED